MDTRDMRTPQHYLTTSQLARELGLHEITLIRWRARGEGPSFVRLSRRAVRYPRTAVDAWMAENTMPAAA